MDLISNKLVNSILQAYQVLYESFVTLTFKIDITLLMTCPHIPSTMYIHILPGIQKLCAGHKFNKSC